MRNYHESVEINRNQNWPNIPDHSYRIVIIGSLKSGKTNVILNLMKYQRRDIDKIYLYVKDPFESKYQLLINRREKIRTKKLKNSKEFIDYLQTIDVVYENLEDYNPPKKRKVLILFNDMIADMEANKKLSAVVTEFFLRSR